jgi:hypothetical protein
MMRTVVVRYTTHPDRAEENEALVRAVYAELASTRPPGFRYTTSRLEDGVSFVHVAFFDGEENPLDASASFRAFVAGIGDRCVEAPVVASGSVIGSYGLGS